MKLPAYIADGPDVSTLAYHLCVDALNGRRMTPVESAARHDVDEADVLRALAELADKGVLAREVERA